MLLRHTAIELAEVVRWKEHASALLSFPITLSGRIEKRERTIPLHMKLQHLHQLEGLREDQDLVRALLVPLLEESAEDL